MGLISGHVVTRVAASEVSDSSETHDGMEEIPIEDSYSATTSKGETFCIDCSLLK
jgi:hypothetical protein